MYRLITMIALTATLLASCSGNRSGDRAAEASTSLSDSSKTVDRIRLFLAVGTYTSDNGSRGIYIYRFDTLTGKSDSVSMVEVTNPSYLTFSPDEQYLYAVGENDDEQGAVHAFSFDKGSGTLKKINSRATGGNGPCYITIDARGRNVHTANYGGGSISSFQVNDDGSLSPLISLIRFSGSGPDSLRQQQPHLHCVAYSPDGGSLFAADLGSDKLYRFPVQETPFLGQPVIQGSGMTEIVTPPGTGPRHFTFHPDGGRYLYLLGELSGEVLVYEHHWGELELRQVIAADTVGARGSADIHVSPDGRFLYASNRLQADGIAIFAIDPDKGTLTKVGYQPTAKHPRNFVITPNGNYLLVASRDDNKIQVFAVDTETGLLTDTDQDIPISKPVCLKFAGMK
jgi:6-phosphogluconolactonase (cycloisomerase 2 family)